jgi:hypothetical protein
VITARYREEEYFLRAIARKKLYHDVLQDTTSYHALSRQNVITTCYHEEWYYHKVSWAGILPRDTMREGFITGYHECLLYHGVLREICISWCITRQSKGLWSITRYHDRTIINTRDHE